MSKKHTIEFIKEEFKKVGYSLVTDVYKNSKQKLEFICDEGHKHTISYSSLKSGQRCGKCCNTNKQHSYRYIQKKFKDRGYTLLSDHYKNIYQKLDYICPKGHEGNINYNDFRQGHGCMACGTKEGAEKTRLSYSYVKTEIEKEGYKLLSDSYENAFTEIKIECDRGHIIKSKWCLWQRGVRCKVCANESRRKKLKLDYDHVKVEIEKEGYRLLSDSYENSHTYLLCVCPNNHTLLTTWNNFQSGYRCGKCSDNHSKAELEIFDFVKNYFDDAISGDRKLIYPFELDIVIPSKKIAIEYNGLYYHSESMGKDRNYHLNKLQMCNEIGYKLITIFEDEWINKQNIVLNRLKYILGVSDSSVIHARKCIIKEIDAKAKNEFLNRVHIQGADRSKVKLGAFFEDQLVSVMTFSKGSIAKGSKFKVGVYELNRFCSDSDYQITGIANRFISYFKKNYEVYEIFTYGDKRWSDGNLYKQLGFEFVHDSAPNYWYVEGINRIHRFNFRKSELKTKLKYFNPDMTEWENMQINGFDRIWDCGNVRWKLNT